MLTPVSALARSAAALCVGVALALPASVALAQAKAGAKPLQGQVVKLAWIDPLSGPFGPVGTNQLNSWKFFIEKFNANNPAGVKFEITGYDNKGAPGESLNALKLATDAGARYIIQGNGSGVALALIDAINKYNERNPGKELVYLNEAAVDPDLTNSKCSFWHFRFDADTTMKMEALSSFMKDQKDIHKVYILGQNYSHGVQVAKYAKEDIKRKRPDIEIVGEDLHPIGQVRDFSPYIAKIKASGADAVVTGNWGADLSLLVKAAVEAGYTGKFFTYYAGVTGTPTALGTNGAGKVFVIAYAGGALMGGEYDKDVYAFKAKYNDDFYTGAIIRMLEAMTPGDGAGQVHRSGQGRVRDGRAEVEERIRRRGRDAQVRPPAAAAALHQRLAEDRREERATSVENTGMTFAQVVEFPNYVSSTPTSCQMKRPSAP